jgi:hypothetical protein
MSTPINVDPPIDPTNLSQTNTTTLSAYPTLRPTTLTQSEAYNKLPNIYKNTITPIALKFSTIICKIDNLKTSIDDLSSHLAANTAPDYITKQFKNILKNENELLVKQAVIKLKLNQLNALKIAQTNELIIQFNQRSTVSTPQLLSITQTLTADYIPTEQSFWESYLDFHISLKLIDFRRKQALDQEIKAKKQLLFNEKNATDSIPVVFTKKDLRTLDSKLKKLAIKPKTRPRSNTTNKQATNSNTTSKSTTKTPKKVFHARKQNKSRTVPPKPKNTGKKN